jgi:hypothetical protein
MKRYLCTKNSFMADDGKLAFKAGKPYPSQTDLPGIAMFTDEAGAAHTVSGAWLSDHFRELEPLEDVKNYDRLRWTTVRIWVAIALGIVLAGLAVMGLIARG